MIGVVIGAAAGLVLGTIIGWMFCAVLTVGRRAGESAYIAYLEDVVRNAVEKAGHL